MTFQFTLLTDTPYSPIPRELLNQPTPMAGEQLLDETVNYRRTIVAVEVQDNQNGAVHYWSLAKLRHRLELMRDMCRNEAEKSPVQSPASSSSSSFSSAAAVAGMGMSSQNQSLDNSTISGNDPFYDRFPWFRLVGRAFVLLGSLLYPVPLVHNVPIVNEKGDVRGYLRVAVQAVVDDENGDYSSGVKQSARISFSSPSADKWRPKSQETIKAGGGHPPTTDDDVEVDGSRMVEGGQGGSEFQVKTEEETKAKENEGAQLPDHLTYGRDFTFRITILHAVNIPLEYSDIFCQFHFVHHQDEAFSTEPIRNTCSSNRSGSSAATAAAAAAGQSGAPISFCHVQNITVKVGQPFVDYVRNEPLVLEVFGHLQQSLARDRANPIPLQQSGNRLPPKRMLPPLLPVSQPLRSTKFGMLPPSPTCQVKKGSI